MSTTSRQQAALTATLETNHKALGAKVDELATAIKVDKSAAAIASVTTLMGETYAQVIHRVMTQIAAGWATSTRTPRPPQGSSPVAKR